MPTAAHAYKITRDQHVRHVHTYTIIIVAAHAHCPSELHAVSALCKSSCIPGKKAQLVQLVCHVYTRHTYTTMYEAIRAMYIRLDSCVCADCDLHYLFHTYHSTTAYHLTSRGKQWNSIFTEISGKKREERKTSRNIAGVDPSYKNQG